MKTIYTLAALAFLATTANAGNCWHRTGNWTGGESYDYCGTENNGGGGGPMPHKCPAKS